MSAAIARRAARRGRKSWMLVTAGHSSRNASGAARADLLSDWRHPEGHQSLAELDCQPVVAMRWWLRTPREIMSIWKKSLETFKSTRNKRSINTNLESAAPEGATVGLWIRQNIGSGFPPSCTMPKQQISRSRLKSIAPMPRMPTLRYVRGDRRLSDLDVV
jgi:hypothetical protein